MTLLPRLATGGLLLLLLALALDGKPAPMAPSQLPQKGQLRSEDGGSDELQSLPEVLQKLMGRGRQRTVDNVGGVVGDDDGEDYYYYGGDDLVSDQEAKVANSCLNGRLDHIDTGRQRTVDNVGGVVGDDDGEDYYYYGGDDLVSDQEAKVAKSCLNGRLDHNTVSSMRCGGTLTPKSS